MTTEEAMGRQQDMKLLRLKKEDTGDRKSGEEGSVWLTPPLGGINSSRKEIYIQSSIRSSNVIK